MVEMAESYVYTPLDQSKGSIRLLCLCQGEESDEICCDVVECSLSDDDYLPYEALSYTWGGGLTNDSLCVLLDGKKRSVTQNLFDALIMLRFQHEPRYLWIDALCINQMDDSEKGHQVGQMKDVYEKAERVLIWLGAGSTDTDILMVSLLINLPCCQGTKCRSRGYYISLGTQYQRSGKDNPEHETRLGIDGIGT